MFPVCFRDFFSVFNLWTEQLSLGISIAELEYKTSRASPWWMESSRLLYVRLTSCWWRISTDFQPFSDSSSSRTLRVASYTSVGNMTIESCLAFCTPAGYKYAGVEYGRVSYSLNFFNSFHLIPCRYFFHRALCRNAVCRSFFLRLFDSS